MSLLTFTNTGIIVGSISLKGDFRISVNNSKDLIV